jgi:hypothetical protein
MSEIIKKAKVSKDNLPTISSTNGEYSVRYRIVSEDKNRTSAWSQIFNIDPDYTYVPGKINIASSSGATTVSWDPVTIKIGANTIRQAKEYDIWVRWSKSNADGDWKYAERISGTSITLPTPDTYFINSVNQSQAPNRITIEIFLKGEPLTRDSAVLKVYSPTIHTVS